MNPLTKPLERMTVKVSGTIKLVNAVSLQQEEITVDFEMEAPIVYQYLSNIAPSLWSMILGEFAKSTSGFHWREMDLFVGGLEATLISSKKTSTVKPPLSEEAWILDGFNWRPLRTRTRIGKGRF